MHDFSDTFTVEDLNPEGKPFERVNRLKCTGSALGADNAAAEMLLDINCEIYEVKRDDRLFVAFMSSLDGQPDDGEYKPYTPGTGSVMDNFDYVMHGMAFDIAHAEDERITVSASFGGLLMELEGHQEQLKPFAENESFYILIRRT